jgi:hypothetical protein
MDVIVFEFDAVGAVPSERPVTMTELTDLQLAIVGGGIGDVVCH